jgi:hypothetical protein
MAHTAARFPVPETVDLSFSAQSTPMPQLELATHGSDTYLVESGRRIGIACRVAADYSTELLDDARRKTSELTTCVRERAEKIRDEQPLEFLGVLAGVAFVGGMALRIWRSGKDE